MSHKLNWRIKNKKVAEDFQEWVQSKHGKKRGALGEETEKALKFWMENQGKPLKKANKKTKETINTEIDEIIANLEERYPNGAERQKRKELHTIIAGVTGHIKTDTINGRMRILEGRGVITEGNKGNFSIFKERIKEGSETYKDGGILEINKGVIDKILEPGVNAFMSFEQEGEKGTRFKVKNESIELVKVMECTLIDIEKKWLRALGFKEANEFANWLFKNFKKPEDGNKTRTWIHTFKELQKQDEEKTKIGGVI